MKYLQDDDLARWTAALSSELTGNTASSSHGSGSSRRLQMSSAMMMMAGGGSGGGGGGGAGSSGGNTARRRLQGRLEAYSMKRAGNDKQYAQVLGKKFVEQIHEAQQQLADCKLKQQQQQQQQQDSKQQQQHQKQQAQKVLQRKRSQSVGGVEAILSSGGSGSGSSSSPTRNRKDETVGKAAEGPGDDMAAAASGRKNDASPAETTEAAPCKKRKRAVSFDSAVLGPSRKKKGQKQQQHAIMGASVPTGLGDFTEQSTRRLMTDLILTLNSSFPDYDFSETKASDFTAVSVPVAVRRINERLSEWAISSSGNGGGGSGEICASSRIHNLWTAVDKSIRLTECQVYAYQPGTGEAGNATLLDDSYMEDDYDDDDDDVQNLVAESDDEVGAGAASSSSSPPIVLWSFYYLFVNKNLKRILLFSCVETMKRQYMAYNNYYEDDDTDRLLEGEDDANTSMPTFFYPSADAADTQDYIDLDPEAPTAGGIPVSSI